MPSALLTGGETGSVRAKTRKRNTIPQPARAPKPARQWDLDAFQQNKNILTIIGGFNFAAGKTREMKVQYTEPLGALFPDRCGAYVWGR